MNKLRLGQLNFYTDDDGKFRIEQLINYANKYSSKYEYEYKNCLEEECDIVFYSLYDKTEKLNYVKGKPLLIYWTDELLFYGADNVWDYPFDHYKGNNLSISFYEDSDTNCYFPYGVLQYDYVINTKTNYKYDINEKIKFGTFCAHNECFYNALFRTNFVKYINDNYKEVTCCGVVLNNTNGVYLPWDINEAIKYHNQYRFNICFENEHSGKDIKYITEKIFKAYVYNTIPVYWGCDDITDIFNENSFINCNGLNYEEMLEKVKEVDNNDKLYADMLTQYPFKDKDINYKEYYFSHIIDFIESKI